MYLFLFVIMEEGEACSLIIDEERKSKSVRPKDRGNFEKNMASVLDILNKLHDENVEGKDGKLHSLYERIHRMEQKYVSDKVAMVTKKVKTLNNSTTDISDRESDSETSSEIVRLGNRRKVRVKENVTRRNRKYTVDGTSSVDESSEDIVMPKKNIYVEEFYSLRNKGENSADAGWAVLISIESEKLVLIKQKEERKRIKASKPWPYGVDKVQKVEDFLEDFERYAREQFGSDKNRWAVELRNYLDGQARRVYFSVYKPGIKYSKIVKRIKSWCSEDRYESDQRMSNQREFWTARMNNDERLSEYALRLQTLYESAVPSGERDKQALKDQFMATIPIESARRLKARMGRDVNGKRVRWRDIVSWSVDDDVVLGPSFSKPEVPPLPVWAFTHDSYSYRDSAQRNRIERNRERNFAGDMTGGSLVCKYCKKRGHVMKDCWRMKGLCLLCGQEGHRVSVCDKRRSLNDRSRVNNQNELSVKCYGCGEFGHKAFKCPIIAANKRKMQSDKQDKLESTGTQGQVSQCSNLN